MTTVGSICTGYGGLEMALQLMSIDTDLQWVSEIDPDVQTVLDARYPNVANVGDITKIPDLPPVEIITAGFPCQPISIAGRHKGVDDERWIWPEILETIRRMDPPPRLLLLENVPRLLTINDGDAMAQIVEGLASIGFMGRYRLLRARDLGACHDRRRWFAVATHTDRLRDRPLRRDDLRDASVDGHREPADVPTRPEMALPEDTPPGHLLPTPYASDGDRGPDYARARDRRDTHGSGGDDLVTAIAKLIPTPSAWLGRRPGNADLDDPGSKRVRSNGRRTDEVVDVISRLIPTPTTSDARGPSPNHSGTTAETIDRLLPSPTATLGSAGHTSRSGDRQDELLLGGIVRSLPTPLATDGRGGRNLYGTGERITHGPTMSDVANLEMWGDYVDAINSHISITGILPPDPVDEGRRLNPAFVEWMMMLPAGWVTDVDIRRTAQLRILGNGVVPAQAATAYALLLAEMAP